MSLRYTYNWIANPIRPDGNQTCFDVGNYLVSIIDDGYGAHNDLFEMAVIDKVSSEFVSLPGIVEEDGVAGYLTLSEIDLKLTKLSSITGEMPIQRY